MSNLKKTLIFFGAIALIVAVIAAFALTRTREVDEDDVLATVGDEKVTRSEYDDLFPAWESFFEYTGNEEVSRDIEEKVLEILIEEKVIISEARKRGLEVDPKRVEEEYQAIVSQYESEEIYEETIRNAYGWTPELTKRRIELDILKENLSDLVLRDYDVEYLNIRAPVIEEDEKAEARLRDLHERFKEGATLTDLIEILEDDPEFFEPLYRSDSYARVNAANHLDIFAGPEDFEAIRTLENAGDVTEVVKSSGGYWVFYIATRVGQGEFNTWEEFIAHYHERYVKKPGSLKESLAGIYRDFFGNKVYAYLNQNNYSRPSDAPPTCSTGNHRGWCHWYPSYNQGSYHYSGFRGHIRDINTKVSISGVSVRARMNPCYSGITKFFHDGCTSAIRNNYSEDIKSRTVSSNSGGNYTIGGTYPPDSNRFMSCWVRWETRFSKSGYNSFNIYSAVNDGAMVTRNIELVPTAPTTYTLSVTKDGSGSGRVTSSPSGINCGNTCSRDFADGTEVTLTASPDTGSTFAGWSGACSGTGSCTVTMDRARNVNARFNVIKHDLKVTKDGSGSGRVTSSPSGINCGNTCENSFNHGTEVTLTASPDTGSTFAGWSGACSGTGSCTVTMDRARNVNARFNLAATGSLSCGDRTHDSISLNYEFSNAGNDIYLCTGFWGLSTVANLGSGSRSGTHTHSGLDPDTTYTYYLKERTCWSLQSLSQRSCKTRPLPNLSVSKIGGGTGVVRSDPAGIHCGETCIASFGYGDTVTLIPEPSFDSEFVRWSGHGTNSGQNRVVQMFGDRNVTARFDKKEYTLTVTRTGGGSISLLIGGQSRTCNQFECIFDKIEHGTDIVLTPNPDSDHVFYQWLGICEGSEEQCSFDMEGDYTARADFRPVIEGNLFCDSTLETSAVLRYDVSVRKEGLDVDFFITREEDVHSFSATGIVENMTGSYRDEELEPDTQYNYSIRAESEEPYALKGSVNAECKTKLPLPEWKPITPFGKVTEFFSSIYRDIRGF